MTVTYQPDLCTSFTLPSNYKTTGDHAYTGSFEHFTDFNGSYNLLTNLRFQQTSQCQFHIIDQIINYFIIPDIHNFSISQFSGLCGSSYMKSDNYSTRGLGQ